MTTAFEVPARLRLDTLAAVERSGLAAIAAGAGAISFAALTDLDSSAVAAMLAWKRSAEARKTPLAWQAVPDALLRIAQLYGVASLLALPAERTAVRPPPHAGT